MTTSLGAETPSLADQARRIVLNGTVTLPPLPEIANRLLDLIKREDASIERVSELIANEPALAATVLRVANSATFGGLREVAQLDQAIARLGMRQVGHIVTGVVHRSNFETADPLRCPTLRTLWDHAITVALASRRLAASAGGDSGEAFLAGLLHDIGKLVVLRSVDAIEALPGAPPVTPAVMEELIDTLHVELGHHVLQTWKISEPICRVALLHHEPRVPPGETLVLRVQVANAIARKLGAHTHPDPDLNLGELWAVERLNLGELDLAALVVDLEDEIHEVQRLL